MNRAASATLYAGSSRGSRPSYIVLETIDAPIKGLAPRPYLYRTAAGRRQIRAVGADQKLVGRRVGAISWTGGAAAGEVAESWRTWFTGLRPRAPSTRSA